ncbi:MAG: hypothetical protein IJQ31_02380 [Thermoguttaceae bacterium]|nr:hypothetical protein [Thermoguttaceae bacterium]
MRFQVQAFMVFFSVCLMLFVSGCGGGKKKPSPGPAPMPEQNQQIQAPEPPAPEKKKVKKIKKKKTDQAASEDSADVLPEELRIAEVTLPASSSQWTEKEIAYIRRAQKDLYDMTIQELIDRLNNPEIADEAAGLLLQFVPSVIPGALALEEKWRAESEKFKDSEDDPRNSQNRSNQSGQPNIIEFYQLTQAQIRQIFEALSSSTCETAKKATAAFLAGTIMTDDNKSALDSALNGYAEKAQKGRITKEEEDFLLAFLLIPEKGVKLAAEYAEVEPPEIEPVELDQNGNPIQNQDALNALRGNHQPIEISPEKWVQFKFVGGNGSITKFTPQEVQKQVLAKYCPFSSANFRARIAEEITSQEVMSAADTETEQAFLLNEVLEKFIMKRDFANAIAHILIYKQPDLDDKWKSTIEENLLKSCKALTQNHFGFFDEKTLEDYKKAVQVKAAALASEKQRRLEAEQKADAPGSSEQVPVSLLSKKAQMDQSQNRLFGSQSQTVQLSPLVELMMNPDECSALEKEVWSPEMRALLLNRLEESLGGLVAESIANMPELGSKDRPKNLTLDKDGLSTLEMYMTIPCLENRAQVYNLLDKAWLLGPEPFRMLLFDKIETEPGALMVVKSLDRRVAPKEKEKRTPTSRKPNRNVVKEREKSKGVLLREKKTEVGTAWMDQVYSMVCQWCGKFSQAAQAEQDVAEINRILNPKLPKAETPTLSEELKERFQPIPGIDVVALYTNSDPEMPPIAPSSGLKITFIELRCTNQLSKLISVFKSKNPHLLERGKLGDRRSGMNNQTAITNATWLEKFEVNEETGRTESIDILVAPTQSERLMNYSGDINQPRKGPEPLSIYVLVMEMDDLTGEHVSKLGDEDDSYANEDDEDDD